MCDDFVFFRGFGCMLNKINKMLVKIMAFFIPVCLVIGVILSEWLFNLSGLIPWIFAFMTFAGSLNSSFASMKQALLSPVPLVIALFFLHVLMPLWALGIGHVVFHDDMFTITGLVLAMAIPTGISSVVWVAIYKGNIALSLSIILIDTLLSPLIVPLTMSFLVGGNVELDVFSMTQGLILMIVIPSIVGMMLNQLMKGRSVQVLSEQLSPISKIGMGLVVMLNGAVVAPYLLNVSGKLIVIAIVVFFIACSGYLFSFYCGKLFKQDKETVIALLFNGGMRNISAGAVLAISYFPAAVAVPVIMGMLFQQTLASAFGVWIDRHYKEIDKI